MKASILLLTFVLIPTLLRAEKVTAPTPLRIEPAPDSPVAMTLPAGADVTLPDNTELPAGMLPLPADWIAVRYDGTFQGYVSNDQVLKDFSIEPGAGVLLEASPDAPLLTVANDGDETEVVDVGSGWTRILIHKPLLGYVFDASGQLFAQALPAAPEPSPAKVDEQPAPPPPTPLPPTTAPRQDPGLTPIAMTGKLERTRRIFGRGPEQDFQLIDTSGNVLAYLDTGSLLTTEPVANFLGLVVDVTGVPSRPPKSKVIVIQVESLRLALPF